jgi:hypothetical protein
MTIFVQTDKLWAPLHQEWVKTHAAQADKVIPPSFGKHPEIFPRE